MSRFLHSGKLLQISIKRSTTRVYLAPFLRHPLSLKYLSSISSINTTNQDSFTVSYLIDSCGLSSKSALTAAKSVQFKTAEKPDSVLKFLKSHGFSETQISKLIARYPPLLLANPEKTLKPKIDFIHSLGISGLTLLNIVTSNPSLLKRSLNNHIIPFFDFLRCLVHTEENLITVLRRSTRIFQYNMQNAVAPNISILRNHGVSESRISSLIVARPSTMMLNADRFNEIVTLLKEMGFDPLSLKFILMIRVMSTMSRLNWERKVEVYRSLGWSEDNFLAAFRVQPLCMVSSEEKIRRVTDFFVNKLEWKPSLLSKYPDLLLFSLEKRVVPRFSVLQILMSNGLINKDFSYPALFKAFKMNEMSFLEKFVIKNQERVPEILMAYRGKSKLVG